LRRGSGVEGAASSGGREQTNGNEVIPMEFKLILVIVDTDRTEQVLQATLTAGATGATILGNARGVGLSQPARLWGLELFNSRDMVMVLVDSSRADAVLDAALMAGKLDETRGTGIALQLSVDKAVGLTEHMKMLAQAHPKPS